MNDTQIMPISGDLLSHSLFFPFLFLILLLVVVSIVYSTWCNGISPMPTSPKAKETLLSGLPPGVSGRVYELGSGWGTLVFPLAKQYPFSQVIGYETSPLPYLVSRIWQMALHLPNVTIKRVDFYTMKLNDASLIMCYLYPEAMVNLRDKFQEELKPGTWVISNTFAIPEWTPETILEVDDLYHTKIYLYKVKLNNNTASTNTDNTI